MKRLSFFILTVLPLILSAQTNTTITGHIKGLKAGKWVYCEAIDKTFSDSVKPTAGEFKFKLNIPKGQGNVYALQIGNIYTDTNYINVYVDGGAYTITGNGPDFIGAKLSGTASADDYNAFKNFIKNDPSQKAMDELYKKSDELYNKHDSISLAAMQPQFEATDSLIGVAVSQWVTNHPNSPVSAYIISMYLKSRMKMPEIEILMNKLPDEAKNNVPARNLLHSIEVDKVTGIGKTAPDFIQNDSTGKPVSLKDFRGKYVLLDFWASWCHPCREENPNILKAYNQYKDKNFTILSISFDDKREDWLKAIQKDGLVWNHASDLKGWDNAVEKQYDIEFIPSNVLIDPSGKIIAKNLQGDDLQNKLAKVL